MIIPTTMDEQWIKEMQQKMADYQWPAPELSWDELDQALTANHPHKTRQLWLRRIAAAAVILLITGVGTRRNSSVNAPILSPAPNRTTTR